MENTENVVVKPSIKERFIDASEKWANFVEEHPVIWYGGSALLGAVIGKFYDIGYKKGIRATSNLMISTARAATDDESFTRFINGLDLFFAKK